MKLDKKELIYECSYKNMRWGCRIKDIEHTKQITGFTVSGKGSLYHVYLIEFNQTRWLDIPEIGISSELSHPDDIFWNSEKLAEHTNSIIDGLTIANGLKMINKLLKEEKLNERRRFY